MKVKLFSIKDIKAGCFMSIFPMQSEILAKRAVINTYSSGHSIVSSNPEDCELFMLGEFDDSTGVITENVEPVGSVVSIINEECSNLRKKKNLKEFFENARNEERNEESEERNEESK